MIANCQFLTLGFDFQEGDNPSDVETNLTYNIFDNLRNILTYLE